MRTPPSEDEDKQDTNNDKRARYKSTSNTRRTRATEASDNQEVKRGKLASEAPTFNLVISESPPALTAQKSVVHALNITRVAYDDEESKEADDSFYSLPIAEARYTDALRRWEEIEESGGDYTIEVQRSAADGLLLEARSLQQEYNFRTRELFDQIPFEQRRVQHYHQAILCALDERDHPRLLRLHYEALFRFPSARLDSAQDGIFTSKILSGLTFHSEWDHASKFWGSIQRRFRKEAPEGIWSNINKMSYFILHQRICQFGRYYQSVLEKRTWEASERARDLLQHLALNALSRPVDTHGDAPLRSARDLIEIVEKLTASMSSQPWNDAVKQLLSADLRPLDKKAMYFYTVMRRKADIIPFKPLLSLLMVRLRGKFPRYAARIFEDYKRFYPFDPEEAALLMINSLAFRGDLEAVLRLIANQARHSPETINSRYLERLMMVYMRRADITKVVSLFDSFVEKYDFKPTLACWHILIMAHSRVNDVKGAASTYRQLCRSGVELTPNTYEIMLGVHARRGDIDPIKALLNEIRKKDVQVTMPMLDFVVLAYLKRNEILAAEKLCRQFLTSNVEGSRLRMWNFLLLDAALKWSFQRVNRVFLEMQVHNIGYDDRTLAALMYSLCNEHQPHQAHKLVNKVMPRLNIQPTTLHWAILMKGYLKVNKVRNAFMIYRAMLKRGGRPDLGMKMLLMKAASMSDVENLRYNMQTTGSPPTDSSTFNKPFILPTADAMLATMEDELSPADLAQNDTPLGVGPSQRMDEAAVSGAYQFLTYLYGVKGSSAKVDEVYAKFEATSKRFYPDTPASPSIRMLSSLMVDYRKTKYIQGMEQSWALALQKAETLSRAYTHGRTRQRSGWVLPQYEGILDLCLGQYILFLRESAREGELSRLIQRLVYDGYWISSLNLNLYIQSLSVSSNPRLQIQAFRECEERLMPGWQGWFSTTSVKMPPKRLIRFRVKQQQPKLRKLNLRRAAPTYRTLVMMARLWMDLRKRDQFERAMGGTFMRQLGKVAPKTVEAIQAMPKMNDRLQTRLLPEDG